MRLMNMLYPCMLKATIVRVLAPSAPFALKRAGSTIDLSQMGTLDRIQQEPGPLECETTSHIDKYAFGASTHVRRMCINNGDRRRLGRTTTRPGTGRLADIASLPVESQPGSWECQICAQRPLFLGAVLIMRAFISQTDMVRRFSYPFLGMSVYISVRATPHH
jgi:hypothetical protein